MKKAFLSMATLALFFTACNDDIQAPVQEQQIDMSDFYVYTDIQTDLTSKFTENKNQNRTCYTMNNLNRLLDENPGLEKRMYDIEYQTRKFIATKGKPSNGGGKPDNNTGDTDVNVEPISGSLIKIPVHVNVLYNTNDQNVSTQQIVDQITVLNIDFNNQNTNISKLPGDSTFANDVADTDIEFTFDPLTDITRKYTDVSAWSTNDDMKKSSRGGIDPTSPETTMNIWICNMGGGILGYAQFPGGPLSTDGIVLLYSSLPGGTAAPYNEGRTATHEVGHYLNLRHIWGDGRCRQDDFVADTPSSDRPNYRCPSYPTVHCQTADMTMNYMDYTNDSCMYMFTDGQSNRMRAIFQEGGARASMIGN
ncbi:zinc metalloprotease [Aestuariivivens sp. NBU2969]|uniref:zinc metalloprotease n=1 Tax=Aestuariivivens sp. NBU2969 TaxID=2873267 RepID=UPI001CC035B6|nr:zinc metalloprotease [Aestuariivivens sp. NBU2969]